MSCNDGEGEGEGDGEGEAKPSDLWRWAVIDNNPTPKFSPRAELKHRMSSLTMPRSDRNGRVG